MKGKRLHKDIYTGNDLVMICVGDGDDFHVAMYDNVNSHILYGVQKEECESPFVKTFDIGIAGAVAHVDIACLADANDLSSLITEAINLWDNSISIGTRDENGFYQTSPIEFWRNTRPKACSPLHRKKRRPGIRVIVNDNNATKETESFIGAFLGYLMCDFHMDVSTRERTMPDPNHNQIGTLASNLIADHLSDNQYRQLKSNLIDLMCGEWALCHQFEFE